jgi:hypothetical protein
MIKGSVGHHEISSVIIRKLGGDVVHLVCGGQVGARYGAVTQDNGLIGCPDRLPKRTCFVFKVLSARGGHSRGVYESAVGHWEVRMTS